MIFKEKKRICDVCVNILAKRRPLNHSDNNNIKTTDMKSEIDACGTWRSDGEKICSWFRACVVTNKSAVDNFNSMLYVTEIYFTCLSVIANHFKYLDWQKPKGSELKDEIRAKFFIQKIKKLTTREHRFVSLYIQIPSTHSIAAIIQKSWENSK